MSHPNTDRVCSLFLGRVVDDASINYNKQRFCVSLETTSQNNEKGELPITPGFSSLNDLDAFCHQNWSMFVGLDQSIREMGVVPPMEWDKRITPIV